MVSSFWTRNSYGYWAFENLIANLRIYSRFSLYFSLLRFWGPFETGFAYDCAPNHQAPRPKSRDADLPAMNPPCYASWGVKDAGATFTEADRCETLAPAVCFKDYLLAVFEKATLLGGFQTHRHFAA